MEEHRRALDTAKLPPQIEEKQQGYSKEELIKLLREGKIQQFNELRHKQKIPLSPNLSDVNLSGADLSGAILSRADLSGATFSRANLSRAYLSDAILSRAYLSDANLSDVTLSRAYLSRANLSHTILSGAILSGAILSDVTISNTRLTSIIIGCKEYRGGLLCENADFKDAIIDDPLLTEYLTKNKAKNIPNAAVDKEELQKKLEKRGDLSNEMIEELLASSHLR